MKTCAVVGCKNRSDRNKDVTYHKFPHDSGLKKAWLIAMRRKDWTPVKTSIVCGKHFEENCFIKENISDQETISLVKEAIPTIFPTHIAVYNIVEPQGDAQVDNSADDESSMEYIQASIHGTEFSNKAESVAEYHDEAESAAEYHSEAESAAEYHNEAESAAENHSEAESTAEYHNEAETAVVGIDENDVEFNSDGENSVEYCGEAGSFVETDKIFNHSYFETIPDSNDDSVESTTQTECVVVSVPGAEGTVKATEDEISLIYRIVSGTDDESVHLLKERLNSVMKENKEGKTILKALQQKSRRLTKKIAELEMFINSHRKSHILSDADKEIIKSIPALDNEILTLQLAQQTLPALRKISVEDEKLQTD